VTNTKAYLTAVLIAALKVLKYRH